MNIFSYSSINQNWSKISSDFILDLLKNELLESFHKSECDYYTEVKTYLKESIKIVRKGNRRIDDAIERRICELSGFEELNTLKKEFEIEISSSTSPSIFNETYQKINSLNWADIEAIYYDLLLKLIRGNKNRKLDPAVLKRVVALNQELDFFKNRLIEYLQRVEGENNNKLSGSDFWEKIKDKSKNDDYPGEVHILNFNYTNTILNYGGHSRAFGESKSSVYINPIHG